MASAQPPPQVGLASPRPPAELGRGDRAGSGSRAWLYGHSIFLANVGAILGSDWSIYGKCEPQNCYRKAGRDSEPLRYGHRRQIPLSPGAGDMVCVHDPGEKAALWEPWTQRDLPRKRTGWREQACQVCFQQKEAAGTQGAFNQVTEPSTNPAQRVRVALCLGLV